MLFGQKLERQTSRVFLTKTTKGQFLPNQSALCLPNQRKSSPQDSFMPFRMDGLSQNP